MFVAAELTVATLFFSSESLSPSLLVILEVFCEFLPEKVGCFLTASCACVLLRCMMALADYLLNFCYCAVAPNYYSFPFLSCSNLSDPCLANSVGLLFRFCRPMVEFASFLVSVEEASIGETESE